MQGNATCVERILAAKRLEPVTGDGYEPTSPLVMAAALGHARIVELLLPSHPGHINRAAVVAAGGRPTASSANTVDVLFKQPLTQDGGVPTKNLALGIALLRCHSGIADGRWPLIHSERISGSYEQPNAQGGRATIRAWNCRSLAGCATRRPGASSAISPQSPGPNVTTRCGETPLIMASRYNQLAAVKYLLGRGAEVNLRNKGGETPLMLGAKYPEIVRALEDAGAKK